MCAWRCSGRNNLDLCMQLKSNGIIKSPAVEASFIATDRKHFCPEEMEDYAYDDRPIRHQHVHMSAPHIYASALETLDLKEGCKFLCIGSGSGYFCTLVGHIIGPTGINHGIEIFEEVVEFANVKAATYKPMSCKVLEGKSEAGTEESAAPTDAKSDANSDWERSSRGQSIPGKKAQKILEEIKKRYRNVPQYIVGNCFDLKPENNIRYDRIYVAAGAPKSMCKTLCNFLEIGGSLVGPFDDRFVKVTRRSETSFSEELKAQVRFAPLLRSLEDATYSSEDSEENEEGEEATASPPKPSKRESQVKRRRLSPQKSGCLTFSPIIWSPRNHIAFPKLFKSSIISILILQKRNCLISKLPRHTWFYVFTFMNRDWFHAKKSELELLRELLKNETRARKAAESRAEKAEAERDRALMINMFLRSGTTGRGENRSTNLIRAMILGEQENSDNDDEDDDGESDASA